MGYILRTMSPIQYRAIWSKITVILEHKSRTLLVNAINATGKWKCTKWIAFPRNQNQSLKKNPKMAMRGNPSSPRPNQCPQPLLATKIGKLD